MLVALLLLKIAMHLAVPPLGLQYLEDWFGSPTSDVLVTMLSARSPLALEYHRSALAKSRCFWAIDPQLVIGARRAVLVALLLLDRQRLAVPLLRPAKSRCSWAIIPSWR